MTEVAVSWLIFAMMFVVFVATHVLLFKHIFYDGEGDYFDLPESVVTILVGYSWILLAVSIVVVVISYIAS